MAPALVGPRGYWWAPDGGRLLAARVDSAAVGLWHIADPAQPGQAPRAVRYPAAGTANAEVTLWIAGLDGDLFGPALEDQVTALREAARLHPELDLGRVGIRGEVLHKSIGLLAPFGRAVVYGAAAGELTSVPVTSLFPLKTVSGFSLLPWRAADPERARADIAELTGLLEAGRLRIATTPLPLAEVVQAHRLLEDRTVMGRLVLLP